MKLEPLKDFHLPALFEIVKKAEKALGDEMVYKQFFSLMQKRNGWVIISPGGNLAGSITFSDHTPKRDILIHCSVDEKYQKRWLTKDILKQVGNYVFNQMELPRMTGICIKDKTEEAGTFLLKMGFMHEGTTRKGVRLSEGFFDLKLFGILKEEWKWF